MNARMNARIVCALMMVASMSSVNAQERSPSWQLTPLYTFLGQADGALPNGVILDPANNLYGTTFQGGIYCGGIGCGVAFKIDGRGHETLLHTFGAGSDGAFPQADLLRDSSGVLYGTAYEGGTNGAGTLFKLTPRPTACASVLCPWNETILHNFGFSGDGSNPVSALIQDNNGNVYGTATGEGLDFGTVFKLDPEEYETLYSFTGPPADGAGPFSPLLLDANGNLYGTTSSGGSSSACQGGCGAVFKLTPNGSAWTETVLYSFSGGADGGTPYAGLVADQHGNLYGTTFNGGGSCNCGVVFELIPNQDGSWTESVLWTFTGGSDGGWPFSGMIIDSQGNLYSTTTAGGLAGGCSATGYEPGCGTVFKMSPNGSGWTESVLWTFSGGSDGSYPLGPVVMDEQGNLYGAAYFGGDLNATNPACAPSGSPVGCGVVFKLTP